MANRGHKTAQQPCQLGVTMYDNGKRLPYTSLSERRWRRSERKYWGGNSHIWLAGVRAGVEVRD